MDRPTSRDPLSVLVGDALRAARIARELTLEEVGKQLGVTKTAVCYYERGRSQLHLRQFLRLCHILDVNPAEVITTILQEGSHLVRTSHQRDR
jgi:transcriptional regulator with XRE-family HTH domain